MKIRRHVNAPIPHEDDPAPLNDPNILRPLYGTAWNGRINFDGVLAGSPGGPNDEGRHWSYTQVFRTGAIEGVDAYMLRREYLGKEHRIPSVAFESALIEALRRYLGVLGKLDAPPPYVVALSLLDVQGLRMGVGARYFDQPEPIDRDDLLIPEVLVQDIPAAAHTVLRPLFDAVWNAGGWPRSPYYTADGEWQEPR